MKREIQKRFSFIFRSMLWALLLYTAVMLAFNWDDVSNATFGKNTIAIVSSDEQIPHPPCLNCPDKNRSHISVIKGIVAIMKTVTGIAQISSAR